MELADATSGVYESTKVYSERRYIIKEWHEVMKAHTFVASDFLALGSALAKGSCCCVGDTPLRAAVVVASGDAGSSSTLAVVGCALVTAGRTLKVPVKDFRFTITPSSLL
jgi:hypothetical protein